MKMIKKISAILLIILLFSTSMTVANAESVYANIENISTMVEIPDSFIVTSANVTPGNTVTYSANATTADSSKSLVITTEKYNKTQDIYNFKYLNKKQVNDEVKNIINGNSTLCNRNFSNVISASFKETDNYIVFMLYNSDILNNTNVSYATAYTVINGEMITIKYVSNNATLTIDEKSLFNKITDSITVSELYIKPKNIDMAGVFSTLFIVIIFITIAVAVCVVIYYNSSTRKIHRKESRQLADKYYDELKNEGLMGEIQSSEPIDSNNSANTVKTANSSNTSSVLNVFEKPSLIEDEWEDIDLEKMFSTSSSSASNENIDAEINMETYEDEDVLYLDKAETPVYSQENTDSYEPAESSQDNNYVSKAESAKRFAQMYIGNNHKQDNNVDDNNSQLDEFDNQNQSDDENIDPEVLRRIEERQRQRRLNNRKKRKNSSKRKKSNSSKSSANKNTTKRKKTENKNYSSDPFADFQLDGYWDKYR
ncbi:MAG: hypothetical protein U0O22_08825 [Acutalibacteraceae bacterium]